MGSRDGVLLDSVILIDHFKGIELATSYIREAAPRARVSAITRAEVLAGLDPTDAEPARQLLDCFLTIAVDTAIAGLAAELRRTTSWGLVDALQAATAIHHGLRLATRNVESFPPERFDFVHVPYLL